MSSFTATLSVMFIDCFISPECLYIIYKTSLYRREKKHSTEQEKEDKNEKKGYMKISSRVISI
jgi:hypothetical protein